MIYFIKSTARNYNDVELNRMHGILFTEGVFNTTVVDKLTWDDTGDLASLIATGRDVTIKKGVALMEIDSDGNLTKTFVEIDADELVSLPANATGVDRVDAIILRVDQDVIDNDTINATGSNVVTVEAVIGTGATALSDGAIQSAIGTDKFMRLSDVTVPNGATSLIQDNITDTRNFVESEVTHQARGERYRFLGFVADPTDPETGDMWFNDTSKEMKYFDGSNILIFTTSALDFYSDGIATESTGGNEIISNTGGEDTGQVAYSVNGSGLSPYYYLRNSTWQLFTSNSDNLGVLKLRKNLDDDDGALGFSVQIWTVDGSDEPDTLVESFEVSAGEWANTPENEYYQFILAGSYTDGVQYGVYITGTNWGDYYQRSWLKTQLATQDANVDELYTHQVSFSGGIDQWVLRTYTLDMKFEEINIIPFGETNLTTQTSKLCQSFTSESTSAVAIILKKGIDIGTPTEDIEINFYYADVNDEPTGDVLETAIITRAEWDGIADDTEIEVGTTVALALGQKYCFEINPLGLSDANHRQVWAGSVADTYTGGKLQGHNSVDGYFDVAYDLYFKIKEHPANKVAMTRDDGTLDPALFGAIGILPKNQTLAIAVRSSPLFYCDYMSTSPSGKYIALWENQSNCEIYIYENVDGYFSFVNTFQISGYTTSYNGLFFKDDETLFIGMGNTSGTDQKELHAVPFQTAVDFAYNDLTYRVYVEATGYPQQNIFCDNQYVYLALGGDDFRQIKMSDWSLFGDVTNTGLGTTFSGRTPSGDYFQASTGDIYSWDGTDFTQEFDYSASELLNPFDMDSDERLMAHSGYKNFYIMVHKVLFSPTDLSTADYGKWVLDVVPTEGY